MTAPGSRQNSERPSDSRPRTGFRVGLVQMGMSADLDDNVARAAAKVVQAGRAGAEVVCLPELYRSPYFCQREDADLFDLAETIPGPSSQAMCAAAREAKVAVVVPIFEKRAPGLYHNSAIIIDEGGNIAGLYRKMHIPDDPAFYEKFYFTPGDLGFRAFDLTAGKIGTLICWDQWYPEGARLTALQGAAVLFYPTAIGWHPHEKAQYGVSQRDAWKTVQRGHAIANGVYVAAVNRVGHEPGLPGSAGNHPSGADAAGGPGLEFWGTSFLCDPFGVVLAEGSTDKEEILVAEVDLGRIEEVRRNWPFLRDRRIDAYQGIESRFLEGGQNRPDGSRR